MADRIRELVEQAQSAARSGRGADALIAWQRVLDSSPNHPQALSQLALAALRKGNSSLALDMLRRAADGAPKDPTVRLSLAIAMRAVKDDAGELAALDSALAIDPYFYLALLAKGALMERLNKPRQAAKHYRDALLIAPPASQLSNELQGALQHAQMRVEADAAGLASFVKNSLSDVRGRHASARLGRFDECMDIRLGIKKPYTPQPMMLYFPQLAPIQFYDNEDFPWLRSVEAETDKIREEALGALYADRSGFAAYVNHPDGTPVNQWAELNHSPRWSAYFLWQDGAKVKDHCEKCPHTERVLDAAPMAIVPSRAPSAFFSTLEPKTRIPPHTGVTNSRLVVHVPLVIPPACGFRVGNDAREWRPGHAWVFDDSIEHEAWNESDQLRVILIFDIWHPSLSMAERDLVCALLDGIRDYYDEA